MTTHNSWLTLSSSSDAISIAITPNNRGMAYGDGFFTTMAVANGAVLWLDYHRQRLISHAQALQLDVDSDYLLKAIQSQAQQLEQGMIKIILTRAQQSLRGYGFSADKTGRACEVWLKATAMTIETSEQLPLLNGKKVFIQPAISATCLNSQLACLPPSLAGLKSLNRLDTVLASGELQGINAQLNLSDKLNTTRHSYGEGLVRDMSGAWVEGTMSNVFYQLNDTVYSEATTSLNGNTVTNLEPLNYLTKSQWYTPSMSQSGVAGVMRQVIVDSLSTTDQPVILRSLTDDDLPHLSRLFFCNAVRGIMPVSELRLLDGKAVALPL